MGSTDGPGLVWKHGRFMRLPFGKRSAPGGDHETAVAPPGREVLLGWQASQKRVSRFTAAPEHGILLSAGCESFLIS